MTLSNEEQALSAEMNQQHKEVEQLQSEVNQLQEKSRVLGLLNDDVTDNQNNIYIID